MSSLKKSLMPDEQIVMKAKFFHSILLFDILLIVFYIIEVNSNRTDLPSIGKEKYIIFFVLLAIIDLVDVSKKKLAVTTKKIYGKLGFFKTKEMVSPLRQIQNIEVKQGVLGHIFGYGTIRITTATGIYQFPRVRRVNKFRNTVMSQLSE